jgi:hypothetical protein
MWSGSRAGVWLVSTNRHTRTGQNYRLLKTEPKGGSLASKRAVTSQTPQERSRVECKPLTFKRFDSRIGMCRGA